MTFGQSAPVHAGAPAAPPSPGAPPDPGLPPSPVIGPVPPAPALAPAAPPNPDTTPLVDPPSPALPTGRESLTQPACAARSASGDESHSCHLLDLREAAP